MEKWKRGLRPTTADADNQLPTNIIDSFEFRFPSAVHRCELHMDM